MTLLVRVRNLLQFQLEQFMLRGPLSRLVVIALAMVLIATGAGLVVYEAPPANGYEDLGGAIWWAFLRLTDSGYLGDDEGLLLRVISTLLTVLGVVLFVGALIATMTQWLNETIETLEAGYTPIAKNNHLLILGWNNRTAAMVEDLVFAQGRVKRFLRRHGGRNLHIVILAERVTRAMAQELKDTLGTHYNPRRITLRSGTPLRADHLRRVDFAHAAAVILPAREFDAEASVDEATIKTLMNAASGEHAALPLMVAEVFDPAHLVTARRAYPGEAELIATGHIVSRLLVQNARHRGLSAVVDALLDGTTNQVFVRECPELADQRLVDVAACFDGAILLGAARDGQLVPLYRHDDDRVRDADRLAFIAREFEDCVPRRSPARVTPATPVTADRRTPRHTGHRRVLVLGWNQKVASLLAEFDAYTREAVALDVVSVLAIAERERQLARRGLVLSHARVRQLDGDFTSYHDLAALGVADYDNIILLASDWLGSAEAADARAVTGYLVLSHLLASLDRVPHILVETMSMDNAGLFDGPHVERLVSPDLQSRLLTQVALRRELHWVMEELFGAGGAEIAFRDVADTGDADRAVSFDELRRARAGDDEILLGVMQTVVDGGRRLSLNPADKQAALALSAGDALVVLAVPATEAGPNPL